MQNDIKVKAAKIISEQLNIADGVEVDWKKSFQELGADSLDIVEMVIKFEDAFKTEIADSAATGFKCLDDVVKYVS